MFNSNLKDFSTVVKVLTEAMDKRTVRVVFKSLSSIEFILLQEAKVQFDSKLKEVKDWEKIVNFEIAVITHMCLVERTGALLRFIEFRADDEDDVEKEIEELKKKIELVNKNIINDNIRYSFLVKSTAKTHIVNQIDWEINEKLFDDTEGTIPKLKYAIIQFETSYPEESEPIPPFPPFLDIRNQPKNKLSITCDLYDIENMISILEDIAKGLREKGD